MNKSLAINIPINLYRLAAIVLVIAGLTIAGNARAELRCDCTQIVDTCSASVSFDEMEIEIESSENACSRVDYLIDGQPYSALVVDGEAEFDWRGQPQSSPQIVVENCRVCADSVEGNFKPVNRTAADNDVPSQDEDAAPKALVKVMPNYPRTALTAGLEGSVTVEFGVNEAGVVQNIRVIDSSDPIFITASIDATSRFRFTSAVSTRLREQFSFKLLDGYDPVVTSATL